MSQAIGVSPNLRYLNPLSRPRGGASRDSLPWQVTTFLALTILVPVEFGLHVGPLFFTWSKAFLLIMSVMVLPAAIRLRWHLFDWLFLGHVAWTAMACLFGFEMGKGIQAGGSYIIEVLVVYLLIRVYISSVSQIATVVRVLFWLALIATIVAIPEAITNKRFVHDFAHSVTGITYQFSDEQRLGLLRAASFFEHPILFGVFCAALVSPVWYTTSGTISRVVKISVLGVGTFLSLSSAPFLIFAVQLALIPVERLTRHIRYRVLIAVTGAFSMAIALQLTTGRGALGVLTMLMIDPATAWYRRAQIEYSMDDILDHPFFGIGIADWSRPEWLSDSIDNHFLLVALRYGIPALLLLVAAIIVICRRLSLVNASNQPPLFSQLRIGWGLMIVALILGGLTVTYFGRMQSLLALYLAIGSCLAAVPTITGAVRSNRSPVPDGSLAASPRRVSGLRFTRTAPAAGTQGQDASDAALPPAAHTCHKTAAGRYNVSPWVRKRDDARWEVHFGQE